MKLMGPKSGAVGVACAMAVGMTARPAWAQCAPVPPGLVSWWTGDVDASDSQGSNDGVLTSGATAGAPGFVGGAFQLDGINDRIITTDANVNLGHLTVAAWIKPDNVSSGVRQRIVTKFNGMGRTAGIWIFDFFADGGLRFNFADSTGNFSHHPSDRSPPGTVTSGTWQFVAATYNGTTIRIYHDAALVFSIVVNNKGPIPALSQVLVIGEDDPANVLEFFGGLIDEVTLFDRALDQTEVQSIYDAGSAGMSPFCCPWDCDSSESTDGTVGIVDFLALLSQWGQVGSSCDFDGGGVGIVDFLDLLGHWGPCP